MEFLSLHWRVLDLNAYIYCSFLTFPLYRLRLLSKRFGEYLSRFDASYLFGNGYAAIVLIIVFGMT